MAGRPDGDVTATVESTRFDMTIEIFALSVPGVRAVDIAVLCLSGAAGMYLSNRLRRLAPSVPAWTAFVLGAGMPVGATLGVRAAGLEATVRLTTTAVAVAVPAVAGLLVVELLVEGEF
jgi:hypothetical protein